MSALPIPPQRLWWLAAGFGVWCSAIVVMYGLHAVGCAFAWSAGVVRLSLSLVLLAHLAVVGWLCREYAKANSNPGFGPTGAFLHWVIGWTAIVALVATAFTLGPPLLLTICV